MYLSISPEKTLAVKNIIGIFDLDKTSGTEKTREYFKNAEKNNKLFSTGTELPRSYVVMKNGDVYLSQYSVKILNGRLKYVIKT